MKSGEPPVPGFLHADRSHHHKPALTNRFRHIVFALREAIAGALHQLSLPPQARVLDYGCAEQPYRHLLPKDCQYEGADLHGNAIADLTLRDDGSVPADGERYDLVLSTQVLEHVTDPDRYLVECFRVLKPGGALLLSTHGLMVWHPDPIDRWRWTCEGLQHITARAGFDVEHFRGVMGLTASGMQFVQDGFLRRLPRLLHKPFIAVMQYLVAVCDRYIDRGFHHYDAYVFVIVARKPEPRDAA